MSDIRPLEPDMVDLSDSSEDSLGEDEREEILQVEDLDVAGQSKESTRGVHEADPNEIGDRKTKLARWRNKRGKSLRFDSPE